MEAKKIRILGVCVSTYNRREVFEKLKQYIDSNKQHYVVTPNSEIILKAQTNEHYFHALNSASLALPDAMGVKIASWFSLRNLKRITGVDISLDLLSYAEKKGIKVGIINWQGGLSTASEIKFSLQNKYPDLKFQVIDAHREWRLGDYELINLFEPKLLFVTFGNPYQEIFLYDYLKRLPYVRLGLAVGSTFDYLTNKIRRAPRFLRIFGFEWLWRAIVRPESKKAWSHRVRLKRIFDAFVVFPFAFFRYKFIRPFLYRPNIACLLYKKSDEGVFVFFLERAEENNHWQIPQGGIDGENLRSAAIRELHEESGSNSFRIKLIKKNIYRYKFSNPKEKPKRFGYKGQKQSLAIAEFTGQDKEIKIKPYNHQSWKWVRLEEAQNLAHECRKKSMERFLEIFNNFLS